MNERFIFDAALDITDPVKRSAYLDEACAQQPELRGHIDDLLAAQDKLGSFLVNSPEFTQRTRTHEPIPERPGSTIGPYKLLQQIGEGGMGVVYMAEQEQPVRRMVALKIIKPGMDSTQIIARFEAERQALAMMEHPNIARVLDAGTTGVASEKPGKSQELAAAQAKDNASLDSPLTTHHSPLTRLPYFVMELVKGVPITNYCDERHLTPRQRLELFIPVCQAVQHAHQKGIIHRDLKPSNVLVAEYDDVPVPKVIDFGVAKATGSKLTERTMFTALGQILGTLEYMSPEQAKLNALDIDTRSDIYALGVLLYELLTGTTPLDKKCLGQAAFDEMLRIIRDVEPPNPSTRLTTTVDLAAIAANRGLDPKKLSGLVRGELDWIVMKALEKDRTRRYETAGALAKDLGRYLTGDNVEACPPSVGYRMRKYARKHRRAMTFAAAFTLLLVSAAVVSGLQAVRATLAEHEANEKSDALVIAEAQVRAERDDARIARDGLRESLNQTAEARDWAIRLRLGYQSETVRPRNPGLALLLAIEAARPQPNPQANTALYAALDECKEVRTFLGHRDEVAGLAFSPDSRRLVSWGHDDSARLWEVATGKQIAVLRHRDWVLDRPRDSPIMQARFTPDGRHVLTLSLSRWDFGTNGGMVGGLQSTANVWDAATGAKTASWSVPDTMVLPITGACSPDPRHVIGFSPDGKRVILTAGGLVAPRLWEVATGRELFALEGHEAQVVTVDSSPDGRYIATGSVDHTARTWDAVTGKQVAVFRGHGCGVPVVKFSPDGRRVLSLGDGVRHVASDAGPNFPRVHKLMEAAAAKKEPMGFIWDAPSGAHIVPLKWPEPDYGFCALAQFSPDGSRVLTAGQRSETHVDSSKPDRQNDPNIWDARTGALLHTLKEPGRNWGGSGHVAMAAFGVGGRTVVTTHNYGRVARLWDAATGAEVKANFVGHGDTVWAAAFSPDGRFLATGSADHTARLWGLEALEPTAPHRERWKVAEPATYAFSSDGMRLALVGVQKPGQRGRASQLPIWDLNTHRELMCKGDGQFLVRSLAFSPDGRWLVAGCWDGLARVWDTATGEPGPVLIGHGDKVLSASFSPDSRRILTTSCDGCVRMWDARSGRQTLLIHNASLRTASFSPDGRQLLTCTAGPESESMGNQGWICNAETGKDMASFGHPTSMSRVPLMWSPDGRRVLAPVRPSATLSNGDAALAISIGDPATGKEACRCTGHTRAIDCAAFSPDGRRVITGSLDRSARVWDAETGALIVVLDGHEDHVTAVAFSSDGRRAVTVCAEAVRVWDAAEISKPTSGHPVRPLAVLAGDPTKRSFETAFFAPDSRRLLTVTNSPEGATTQLWPTDPLAAALARKARELTAEERELYEVLAEDGLSNP